jgi:hypothetical protein
MLEGEGPAEAPQLGICTVHAEWLGLVLWRATLGLSVTYGQYLHWGSCPAQAQCSEFQTFISFPDASPTSRGWGSPAKLRSLS